MPAGLMRISIPITEHDIRLRILARVLIYYPVLVQNTRYLLTHWGSDSDTKDVHRFIGTEDVKLERIIQSLVDDGELIQFTFTVHGETQKFLFPAGTILKEPNNV